MADASQKTEKPTQKRLEKARKEGQYASSRDFVGAMQLLATMAVLVSWGPGWFEGLKRAMRFMMAGAFVADLTTDDVGRLGWTAGQYVLLPVLIGGAWLMMLTLAFQLAVSKFGFSLGRLKPKWNRLSPAHKLKNLPKQNGYATVQTVLTLALCGLALYVIGRRNAEQLYMLPLQALDGGLRTAYHSLTALLWNAVAVFLVFGCIDLFRQLRRHASELKMSRQEIRDEYKETEGNPATRARIRRLQRAARRRKMLKQVRTATAVIVNPTHFAVALRYEVGSAVAPMVVAKGKNHLALRIRKLAAECGIPLIENPPLAQALYKAAALDAEIPPHFYRAVAEVLAYVFQTLNPRGPRGAA
jgi:flagellar biosynthetic protein FlhB